MILALLSLATLGVSQLPPQKLVPGRCVVFLWTRSETPVRFAMLDESARSLRIVRGKQQIDLPQTAPETYAGAGLSVSVRLEISERAGLTSGALVDSGVVRFDVPGKDSEAFPVGGIRACS
jgi:hypothetical protein